MVRARLAVLAAAALWSTAGAALKLSSLTGWQLAFGRSAVAALVLFAVFRESRARPSPREALVGIAYAATVVLFVLANKLTTAANAIFIQDSAPLWVMLLSPLLLREKPSRSELLSAPVFLGGLALFFVEELRPGQLSGNVLAVGSGVAFACCILGLRSLGPKGTGVLAWGNLLAALVCAPFLLPGPVPSAGDVGIVLFLGVFQLALPYALFSWGLRHLRAVEASLLVLLEPVLSPVWAFLFAGEIPGKWALAGGAVILLATLWKTFRVEPAVLPPVDAAS